MDGSTIKLLQSAASRLSGGDRRMFLGEVCLESFDGNARRTEAALGWGRQTVEKGMLEWQAFQATGTKPGKSAKRGRMPIEEANPQIRLDVKKICEPHCHTDPKLKSERIYLNLAAREVLERLAEIGYAPEGLPSERTMRDLLNRMNYRLKRTKKGKPLKKTPQTDAIFENVKAAKQQAEDDPETLAISIDTKTKVKLGEYSLGGKKPDNQ
ncbi:MAG: hypothetical protein AAFP69_17265 [Planctomycetota bacterium]